MITFDEACRIAYEYYAKENHIGLTASLDIVDKWEFMGYSEVIGYGNIIPITVSKSTGKVEPFKFWLQESWNEFHRGIKMTIPDAYKPKIENMQTTESNV